MGDDNQMTFFVFTFCAAPGKSGDNPGTDLGARLPSLHPAPSHQIPLRQKETLLTLAAISYGIQSFSPKSHASVAISLF